MAIYDQYSGTVGGASYQHLSDVIKTSVKPGSLWRDPTPFKAEQGGSFPVTANWNWSVRLDQVLNCDGIGVRSATVRETSVSGTAAYISPLVQGQLQLDSTPLIRAMKKAKSNFNAPMTALDGRKTGKMVLDAAKEVHSILSSNTMGKALRSRRTFSSSWLELNFGWGQLVSDLVHGALELDRLIMGSDGAGKILVFRGIYKPSAQDYRIQPSYLGIPSWDRNFHITPVSGSNGRVSRTYRAVIRYQVENPGLYSASKLGLTNPAFLAWDRVPYSFVVDWVSNIGSYLATLDVGLGLKFLCGTLSAMEENTLTSFERNIGKQRPDIKQYVSSNYNGSGSGFAKRYRRDVITDPHASAYGHLQLWKKDFSPDIWHFLTSMALLPKR